MKYYKLVRPDGSVFCRVFKTKKAAKHARFNLHKHSVLYIEHEDGTEIKCNPLQYRIKTEWNKPENTPIWQEY